MSFKSFTVRIQGHQLNQKEIEILTKLNHDNKKVNIILFTRNIAYSNSNNHYDIEVTKKKLINLTSHIKAINPDALIMIDAEGGAVQRIKFDLLYPASHFFAMFYNKLVNYFNNKMLNNNMLYDEHLPDNIINHKHLPIPDNIINDEIFKFFEEQGANIYQKMLKIIKSNGHLESLSRARAIISLLIEESYYSMALETKRYGIDVMLAPVADFYDGIKGAIDKRSFGKDPELIAAFCIAAMRGIKKAGLKNCLKHFVCQGQARDYLDQVNDGHNVLLSYNGTKDDIMQTEGLVFKLIFKQYQDVDYLMISNLTLNNLKDPGSQEASPLIMSPFILNDLLNEVGAPKHTALITDDIFSMPLKKNFHTNEEKILLIKEIIHNISNILGRDVIIIACCDLEIFDKLGGFNLV